MYRGPVPKNCLFKRGEDPTLFQLLFRGVGFISVSLYRGGEFVIYYLVRPPPRLFTVPYFSRKIFEIERFALHAVILHECHNYLGGARGCPPPRTIIPDAPPPGTFENQDGRL